MMIYECLMLMLMLCKSSYARLTPEVLHRLPLHSDRIQKLGTRLWFQYRLCVCCTSRSQQTSRKGQWTHTSRIKTKVIRRTSWLWVQMDWRITKSSMGATNSNKQSNRPFTLLPSLRIRSRTACRLDLDITKDRTIRWRRSRTNKKIRTRQLRRSQSKCYPPISQIPTRFKAALQQKYPSSITTSWRLSTKKDTKDWRTT